MTRFTSCLLTGALVFATGHLRAQDEKSPDQQQHSHPENNPSSQAHQPQQGTDQPANGQSPDTEQEKSDQRPSKKKIKKNKNNARQVHGTPKPSADTNH